MYKFEYDVSLRITHPEMGPENICTKLGMNAWRKWKKGEQRKSSGGTKLEGVNEYTYCCFELKHSKDQELVEFLKKCNEGFCKKKDVFEEIHLTGGNLEYFIGLYSDKNSGAIFDLELLTQLVELKIELSLDFYSHQMKKK